ncbi:sulfur carrier protein ThiS [bacterium]|nr:sulfur carrier protein ThiS [bacterium]
MEIQLNGETRPFSENGTLTALLEEAGANPKRVAVLLNDHVVCRDDYEKTRLADGDQVEILTFAGGG